MKPISSIITMLALSAGLYANEAPKGPVHAARILKIEAKLVNTPNFQAKGIENKAMEPRQWLEIEAEVEVKTTDPSGYIPQLEASWYAVVPNKAAAGKKEDPVQLMGSSHFKDIRTKDGKVYLSAYIEPQTLERLLGDGHLRIGDFKAFALTLSGEGLRIDKDTGMGPYRATAEEEKKWWVNWRRDYTDGAITAKSKTPFALINIDRYPTEREGD